MNKYLKEIHDACLDTNSKVKEMDAKFDKVFQEFCDRTEKVLEEKFNQFLASQAAKDHVSQSKVPSSVDAQVSKAIRK